MRVGYLGPAGTYTELAARQLYSGAEVELQPVGGIDRLLTETAAGKLDACVVPVENSLEGSVNVTLDVLTHDVSLYVQAEVDLPIHHHLFMQRRLAGESYSPRVITSHPQALAQCRKTIARLYPEAVVRPADSTAAAAALAAEQPDVAAIGSQQAGQLYGLAVVAADVQDLAYNRTRFWALGRAAVVPDRACSKTSIVCYTDWDRPGSLCELLQVFASRGINLSKIESRPARTKLGRYLFYFDLMGSAADPVVAQALTEAVARSSWCKSFGSYPVLSELQQTKEDVQ